MKRPRNIQLRSGVKSHFSFLQWNQEFDWCGTDVLNFKNINSKVLRTYNKIKFYYYNSLILEISHREHYTYRSLGYLTVTTKRRLNEWGPLNIWQEDFIWYYENEFGEKTEFSENMIVDIHGKRLN